MDNIGALFTKHGSDKDTVHSYGPVYDELLAPLQRTARHVLELGIAHGGSLRAWRDFFPKATIHGIDNSPAACASVQGEPRIRTRCCNAASPAVVVGAQYGRYEYDLIVDDASHGIAEQVMAFFWLFPYLRPGGIYVVEDVFDAGHFRHFQSLAGAVTLHDRRSIKGAVNDMMVVIRKPMETSDV